MEQLLKIKDLCRILKCSRQTVYNYLKKELIPAPSRIGSTKFWKNEEILDFIERANKKDRKMRKFEENLNVGVEADFEKTIQQFNKINKIVEEKMR